MTSSVQTPAGCSGWPDRLSLTSSLSKSTSDPWKRVSPMSRLPADRQRAKGTVGNDRVELMAPIDRLRRGRLGLRPAHPQGLREVGPRLAAELRRAVASDAPSPRHDLREVLHLCLLCRAPSPLLMRDIGVHDPRVKRPNQTF